MKNKQPDKKQVESITLTKNNQLHVVFENGREMFVSTNPNNRVRQKLEREYPDLYPL